MNLVEFKEQTDTYRFKVKESDRNDFQDIPMLYDKGKLGLHIFCLKASFMDRLRILFKGRIYGSVVSQHKPLMPIKYSVRKKDLIIK